MPQFIDVPVSRIFLYLENPRHERVDTEQQAIDRLCSQEDVYPLARDIARWGLNPLELFALVPTGAKGGQQSYIVPEGNRRMCAVKLLNDPDRAPASLRKSFEKLAQTATPVTTVPAIVFDTVEDVHHWLERIHNGTQGGIGRKPWNADQKSRFDGGNKNKPALALLDYAEREGLITADERKDKLTTVQRFLTNTVFRETFGFDHQDPNNVGRTRPKEDFDLMTKRFMRDLVGRQNVNSRMNKNMIIGYARRLGALDGVTGARVETESLSSDASPTEPKKTRRKKPRKPLRAQHVQYDEGINSALRTLANEKLESLYHSICAVDLDPHTPLVAIGTWAFFETMTACAGRNDSTSFDSFLNKQRLQTTYGLGPDTQSMREAVARIRGYGNSTKHHPFAATFNGDQLNNDMVTLKPLIVKCIEDAINQGS